MSATDEPGPAPRRTPARRIAGPLLVVAVALTSGGAAMSAWSSSSESIGPLETRLSFVPSWHGGIRVDVPPLGRLTLPTHAGPLGLRATVTSVDPTRTRAVIISRNPGRTVTEQITADSQDALAAVAARAAVVALLAAGVTCGVAFRSARAVLGGTAAVLLALTGSAGVAWATLRTEALNEPTFDGLLAQAPGLIGRVQDFDAYSERVAQLTANVAGVYGGLAALPAAPSADSTRVLWVSDIHNNPAAFDLMAQLVSQFEVAAVVDTGDIVDVGSAVENSLLTRIGSLGVPYLFARGNHDSRAVTQDFLASQPGARVLEAGEVVEVRGVRFAGIGDPLFRPNKAAEDEKEENNAKLRAAGERLLAAVEAEPEDVDVIAVHNPRVAAPLVGAVPLILTGHTHERRSRVVDGTLVLTQGSSGGAGLRTLDEGDSPLPLQMSILHFDADGTLLAVDDVSVGGLGERSVTVERHSPSSYGKTDEEATSGGSTTTELPPPPLP